ncbi:hypothetical protein TPHA_0B04890 [Tetrapisispora phaffii CBS 4417]|uniref:Uncharacterized protein n=1 Tax=Tetrapisispora phaffii (strain ATCC 24235 / CBS 4417 / NBRC 1672 / NRRL Y-8282 / UCD 70-5) TaxID=1071381 RepID=G8BQ78_TETPH|nr:hypothetical protein TPHA_0B04890 [Tetrapisispora phaffii CBS 4417]CCE62159.1 hypothetical protein TPHA_0B04890 [Tetrapisispora phaffii CBS 4417]
MLDDMGLPENISELISNKYTEAIKNKDIEFVETKRIHFSDEHTGMDYLICLVATLAKKPERDDIDIKVKRNPFEVPEPELTVLNDALGDGRYKLVLNKFPVIPEHGLLITNKFEQQKVPLTIEDVAAAHQLARSLENDIDGQKHIIFYNCGIDAGSSQDHKHMQVLRVPEGFELLQDKIVADASATSLEPLYNKKVSFAHFVMKLPIESSKEYLYKCYTELLQKAILTKPSDLQEQKDHNVIICKDWICVIPRASTKARSMDIAFNSLGYSGIILVKHLSVFNEIANQPSQMDKLLLECGFPNVRQPID